MTEPQWKWLPCPYGQGLASGVPIDDPRPDHPWHGAPSG